MTVKIGFSETVASDAQDLIKQILKIDPKERISIHNIFKHPFVKRCFGDIQASNMRNQPTERGSSVPVCSGVDTGKHIDSGKGKPSYPKQPIRVDLNQLHFQGINSKVLSQGINKGITISLYNHNSDRTQPAKPVHTNGSDILKLTTKQINNDHHRSKTNAHGDKISVFDQYTHSATQISAKYGGQPTQAKTESPHKKIGGLLTSKSASNIHTSVYRQLLPNQSTLYPSQMHHLQERYRQTSLNPTLQRPHASTRSFGSPPEQLLNSQLHANQNSQNGFCGSNQLKIINRQAHTQSTSNIDQSHSYVNIHLNPQLMESKPSIQLSAIFRSAGIRDPVSHRIEGPFIQKSNHLGTNTRLTDQNIGISEINRQRGVIQTNPTQTYTLR